MKMCEEFARADAAVELIVPTRHGPQGDPFAHYGIEKNFLLRRLATTDISGKSERITFAYYIDLLSFLFSLFLRRFPSDGIVYTRDYQVALVVRAKHIMLEVHSIPSRSKTFLRALRRVEKFIAITKGVKDALIARGVPAERILVAPDAVDLTEFTVQPSRDVWREYAVDPQKKVVLYTGHFYEWKGAETLAEAAQFLPDSEVVLMGGVARELADFQKTYTANNVYIIGFQPREKMPVLLKSADVLVLPNSGKAKISALYTSPLKLFQYMASGTPIVASDLPSIREILDDSSAYWFTPDDEHSLARQIEHVLSHPDEARSKAVRAREEVKKYTWNARACAILGHL
jgi:glycosyltransferase involved in cell wall biosynthesis